ncbi:hypothetical protein ACCUM_3859 [Candidatus Accumulibacter phosphatis]|uniref:PIN domain-containing protein n=1 Tax=Candidatus Accumulibacter phosphatis TaxID=327160 RepID=A0A5S4EN71_9PROT|nr:hypothetical protein ACCUM_3859 [Candidatus Accumulibacter phosphatis]
MLGCAIAALANVLVTGDKDLLSLHPFKGITIVTPATFLAMPWTGSSQKTEKIVR